MKFIRFIRGYKSLEIVVGPYAGRLQWARSAGFFFLDTDGPIVRRLRRWWTGWHRWEDDFPW
jgi:hypothetical protein